MPMWFYVFLGLAGLGLVVVFIIIAADTSGYFTDDSFRWGVRDNEDRKDKEKEEEG